VLVASTAANAGIEVYNKNGATVNIGGDLEVLYYKGTEKDAKTEQQIEDADIKFDIRYVVNDDVTVGGYWEFQGDQGGTTDGSSAIMGDVYFAVYTANLGSIKIGDLCTFGDDLGIGADYQFGLSEAIDSTGSFCGDEAVKYEIDKGTFYGGIAYRDNQRDTNSTATTTQGRTDALLDLTVGVRAAGFDILAYYANVSGSDNKIIGLEARYALDALELEAGYYTADGAASSDGGDTIALGAEYTMNLWSFALGVADYDFNDSSSEDYIQYFANVDYAVAPGTKLYAEVGANDKDSSETGYAAGVKVEF